MQRDNGQWLGYTEKWKMKERKKVDEEERK